MLSWSQEARNQRAVWARIRLLIDIKNPKVMRSLNQQYPWIKQKIWLNIRDGNTPEYIGLQIVVSILVDRIETTLPDDEKSVVNAQLRNIVAIHDETKVHLFTAIIWKVVTCAQHWCDQRKITENLLEFAVMELLGALLGMSRDTRSIARLSDKFVDAVRSEAAAGTPFA